MNLSINGMDWASIWNTIANTNHNLQQQVGRITQKQMDMTLYMQALTVDIQTQLHLVATDSLLDVCCGNGLISKSLAENCASVTGVDVSEQLIALAQKHNAADNVTYKLGDALRLSSLVSPTFDKALLYFSFQYFDTFAKGEKVIAELQKCVKKGGIIFIGDVPDYGKLSVFYPTLWQRFKYHVNVFLGRSIMGKFWKPSEIMHICQKLGLKVQVRQQPSDFLYAHYRCDYVIFV